MPTRKIHQILDNYLDGSCSEEERQFVDLWLIGRGNNHTKNVSINEEKELKEAMLINIQSRLDLNSSKQQRSSSVSKAAKGFSFKSARVRMVAAAIMLVFGSLLYVYQTQQKHIMELNDTEQSSYSSGAATVPKELAITAGSRKFLIDQIPMDTDLYIEGAYLRRTAFNRIVYYAAKEGDGEQFSKVLHRISVPRGRDLNLILPDGSKIWLNTESQITFPVRFAAHERRIYMAGEAFFEVKSDKRHPFIVESGGFSVRATGTQFNVRAYADEAVQRATLVEGKVDIECINGKHEIHPGEQWSIRNVDHTAIDKVDVEGILANRGGYFVFHEQDIRQIMSQIARWYDIEVFYKGNIDNRKFGGTFSKSKSLEELLEYLKSLSDLQLKIEGRSVTIMP